MSRDKNEQSPPITFGFGLSLDEAVKETLKLVRANNATREANFEAAQMALYVDTATPPEPPPISPPPAVRPHAEPRALASPTAAALAGIARPPGLVGELAEYFWSCSPRPVLEVSLAAAIALTAGVCGRQFNISGAGLNLYLMLTAKTGRGKSGLEDGIDRIVSAVRPEIPMVDQFIGPGAIASGQALHRHLAEHPCFVAPIGEFGLTLQQMCHPRAARSK